jgi:AAA+ ATPase superfamily predicted ATPase
VAGEYFTDRESEAQLLAADIQHGLNVVLISPRRFGKTSLVLRVIDGLRRTGVLVAYVDLLRAPNKERLAAHLAAAIYAGLESPFDRARERAATFFQQLRIHPKPTLNPDGTLSFEFGIGMVEGDPDTDATLEQLLAMPAAIARERQRRVALVLDEFQEIVELDPHLPALMRSVFQIQGDVAHLFLGSRQHLLRSVFVDRGQPLYRLAKPMTLGPIAEDLFVEFLRERFAAGRSQIRLDAARRLIQMTQGHPHDTQELGHFAWALAVAEGCPATIEIIERALETVVDAEDARLTDLWASLTPHQRLTLLAIALQEGRGLYREETRRRNGLGPPGRVQKSVRRLVERELIEPTAGAGHRVPDMFLRAWLRRLPRELGLPELAAQVPPNQ